MTAGLKVNDERFFRDNGGEKNQKKKKRVKKKPNKWGGSKGWRKKLSSRRGIRIHEINPNGRGEGKKVYERRGTKKKLRSILRSVRRMRGTSSSGYGAEEVEVILRGPQKQLKGGKEKGKRFMKSKIPKNMVGRRLLDFKSMNGDRLGGSSRSRHFRKGQKKVGEGRPGAE